jgi:hypothetical protein
MSSREDRRILGAWGQYTVRRLRPWHVAAIQQRPYDVKTDGAPTFKAVGFTILKGKEIVACVGTRDMWRGVCEGWVLTSPLVHECPKLFTALTLRGLRWLEQNKGYHRIGARVLQSFTEAQRWAGLLGFEFEGPEWAVGPGKEDFFRYGRVHR